jgi:hypothetical protein
MENSKKGSEVEEKFVFTGVQMDFEQFRTVMHTHFEDTDQQWFPFVAQTIVKTYHNIVAERTARNATTPIQTDLNKFSAKKIANVELEIKHLRKPVILDLALVKNKKDVIGSACTR